MTEMGPCRECGTAHATNVIMLPLRAPKPGTGWGCLPCGLPADGAVSVLCDDCADRPLRFVCDGYPKEGKRVSIETLGDEAFDHDPNVVH
jgi:hypothetical protein